MGCIKLTYQTPLKVVYRTEESDKKPVQRFISVDPLAADFAGWSPYNYVLGNSIMLTDPDGRAPVGDYYDSYGKWLGNDGKDDHKLYTIANPKYTYIYGQTEEGRQVVLGRQIQFTGAELVGTVDHTTLSFTGEADASNPKRADGTLSVYQHVGDKTFEKMSVQAIGGPWGNGSPENGDYQVHSLQDRGPNGWYSEGMTRDGVGFSLNMDPEFKTGRSLLRIHPDGGKVEGTQGCIGLQCGAIQLNSFQAAMKLALKYESKISLNVDIKNNPNNNGSGPKVKSNGE